MSRQHLPATAGPMLRANQTHEDAVRPNQTQDDTPSVKASRVLAAALKNAERTADEAACSLGVDVSLVRRWCNVNARETISTKQLFTLYRDLGPRFTWAYHVANHHEHKLAQLALRETLQSLSLLAVGIDQ
jgi:hypothetical protein